MVLCHTAQEAVASHREYIDRKTKNVIFTPTYVALRSLSQIQPHLLQRCPQTRQIYIPNVKQIAPTNPKI